MSRKPPFLPNTPSCASPEALQLLARAFENMAMASEELNGDYVRTDWDQVRALARELIADSDLRGRALLTKLDTLDLLLCKHGLYCPPDGGEEDE